MEEIVNLATKLMGAARVISVVVTLLALGLVYRTFSDEGALPVHDLRRFLALAWVGIGLWLFFRTFRKI